MARLDNSTAVASPAGLIAGVVSVLNTILTGASLATGVQIQHFAGEFFSEDGVRRLKQSVSQFPQVMYDVDRIATIAADDSGQMPETEISFVVYCISTDYSSETAQWISSYTLAWKAYLALLGVEFNAVANIHANGYFTPETIERELHVPGLSIHTLRVTASVANYADGTVP